MCVLVPNFHSFQVSRSTLSQKKKKGFKEYCHGWERSEIGEEGEMGLWKEEYTRGNPIFAGVGLGCLPRVFIWWAWTSLLKDTGVRVGEELIEKK